MAHSYSVRPHLLDETAIQKAIQETGFEGFEQGQIAEMLVESYTIDLDLLAAAMQQLNQIEDESMPISKAA